MVAIGGTKKPVLYTSDGEPIGVQNPLPTDGDSVYSKDIWVEQSNINTFDGGIITDLFDNLHTVLSDTTSNNPKEILIHFNRTTPTTVIAFGAFSGNFSNIKISALVSGPIEMTLFDESADNTKYTSRQFDVPAIGFNALRIQFHTADTVSISNIFIAKSRSVVSRIQGQKPDGSFIEFQATAAGNFKTSLEELESGISSNSNSQMNVTQFDSLGNEFKIDIPTGAYATIDYAHHEIHSGDLFRAGFQKDLPNAGTAIMAFTTPNTTEWMHFRPQVDGESEFNVMFYENPTSITGGTSVTARNANRNVANGSSMTIVTDPTVNTAGAIILGDVVFGSGRTSGGTAAPENEWILKQDTSYALIVTNQTTTPNEVNIRCNWYEHESL